MAPPPSNEHQDLLKRNGPGPRSGDRPDRARPNTLRSGRQRSLRRLGQEFRVPDIAAFPNETSTIKLSTHRPGGPDIAVEILGDHDRSLEKVEFFAKIGAKELLLVDRKPWALELCRLWDGVLAPVGKSDLVNPSILSSQVAPISSQLQAVDPRPRILMTHPDGVQRWSA